MGGIQSSLVSQKWSKMPTHGKHCKVAVWLEWSSYSMGGPAFASFRRSCICSRAPTSSGSDSGCRLLPCTSAPLFPSTGLLSLIPPTKMVIVENVFSSGPQAIHTVLIFCFSSSCWEASVSNSGGVTSLIAGSAGDAAVRFVYVLAPVRGPGFVCFNSIIVHLRVQNPM